MSVCDGLWRLRMMTMIQWLKRGKKLFTAHIFRRKMDFFSENFSVWNVYVRVIQTILSSGCKQIDARSGPLVMRRIKLSKLLLIMMKRRCRSLSVLLCLFAATFETCNSFECTFDEVFILNEQKLTASLCIIVAPVMKMIYTRKKYEIH